MSAEIIQFGSPNAPARRPFRRRAIKPKAEKDSIRFAFDGELYEAEFYGSNVDRVYAIQSDQRERRTGNEVLAFGRL